MAKFWSEGLPVAKSVSGTLQYWDKGLPYAFLGEVPGQTVTGASGITSEEAFGTGGTVVGPVTGASGIASEEAFGSGGYLANVVGEYGITSEEAFGSGGILGVYITGAAGIASGETFGDGSSLPAGVFNVLESGVSGIASEEAFGSGGSLGWLIFGVAGIWSAESLGSTGTVLQLSTQEYFATFVGGANVSPYVMANSLTLDLALNSTGNAKFGTYDPSGGYKPTIGQEVLIYKNISGTWVRKFGGSVETVVVTKNVGDSKVFCQVTCVDYSKALSRRLVNKKYSSISYGTVAKILEDLSTSFLVPEGITWVKQGGDDIIVEDIEFNYIPLNEVLDKLCEIAGWTWQVDFFKRLYAYQTPTEEIAPFGIAEDTANTWANLFVSPSRGLYRNRQHIKASFTQTTSNVETSYICPLDEKTPPYGSAEYQLYWDGQLFADFKYAGKVARVNKMYLNDVEIGWYLQTIEGIQAGTTPPDGWKYMQIYERDLQFVWNLLQFPSSYPSPGDVLKINFDVYNDMPTSIMVEDAAEIAARAAIEGNTGVYEAVEEVSDIQDALTLTALAQALLDRFKVMGMECDFETIEDGLLPGQTIAANLPTLGVPSQSMTVESITAQEEAKLHFRSKVKISNAVQQRDALASFRRLVARLRKPANKNLSVVQFNLSVTLPGITNPGLVVGTNVTNAVILRQKMTLKEVALYFKTPPEDGSIVLNIRANNTTIFPSGFSCEYKETDTGVVVYTSFVNAPLTLSVGTLMTIDVVSVGAVEPGKDGTVVITGWS